MLYYFKNYKNKLTLNESFQNLITVKLQVKLLKFQKWYAFEF